MMIRVPESARAVAVLALLILLHAASSAPGGRPGSNGRKYSTGDRMKIERLRALHEDIQALGASRTEVSLATGFTDYHAILHTHCEDSAHTGGTLPEALADAKKVGVDIIMLSDHIRAPKDFMDSWRGLKEGVLFIPGAEGEGYLLHPVASVMDKLSLPREELVAEVTRDGGLIFLSHVESKAQYSFEGLTGMEIYNNHYDAMDEAAMMMTLLGAMTRPEKYEELRAALEAYPAELFASVVDYPKVYLRRWDKETVERRVVGIAANDCHHNQVILAKMKDADTVLVGTNVDDDDAMRTYSAEDSPAIREMTRGREPGDVLASLDLDPYHRSFLNCSTHILATELSESAVRDALREGHCYVAHDVLCDPTGFAYIAEVEGERVGIMGDEVGLRDGLTLRAEAPAPCEFRLIRNGEVALVRTGREFSTTVTEPGAWRVEAWLTLDEEQRVWIYSNPIYVK